MGVASVPGRCGRHAEGSGEEPGKAGPVLATARDFCSQKTACHASALPERVVLQALGLLAFRVYKVIYRYSIGQLEGFSGTHTHTLTFHLCIFCPQSSQSLSVSPLLSLFLSYFWFFHDDNKPQLSKVITDST